MQIHPLLIAMAILFRAKNHGPILDSNMTINEALNGVSEDCPKKIRDRQVLLNVDYLGFDENHHRGQIVIDMDLAKEVADVFEIAFKEKFPIYSMIPISDKKFRKDNMWDDELSMQANNTSCFNYRAIIGKKKLSNHALGRAIDINPLVNPYIKGGLILPRGSKYDPKAPGTLTGDHPVTRAFIARGWEWGGNWTSLKDYQHFEKSLQDKKR